MVKSSKHPKKSNSSKHSLYHSLKTSLKSLTRSSLISVLSLLIQFSNKTPPTQSTSKSYISLLLCYILQDINPVAPKSDKDKSICKSILLEVLKFHKSNSALNSSSVLCESIQHILGSTSDLIQSNFSIVKSDFKFFISFQLLKWFNSGNFFLVIEAIKKILEGHIEKSVFSYFTKTSFPMLPRVFCDRSFTVLLDLDETLGHFHNRKFLARPGVHDFLEKLSGWVELVLFTSAGEEYANYCMKIVDPCSWVKSRLYKQHIVESDGRFCKDLDSIGRDLKRVIIIDNDESYFRKQKKNGIAIKSWSGDEGDRELEKVLKVVIEGLGDGKDAWDIVEDYLR